MGWQFFRRFLSSDGFFIRGFTIAVFRPRGTMPVVRDVLMMLVLFGKRMSRLSYRSVVGMGSSSHDFAGVLLIIFKTKSSVTGSKVCKGSLLNQASEETVGFGGGKLFLMVRIFSITYSEKTVGRSSESKAEGKGEEKFLLSMELKFLKNCLQVVLDWIFAEKQVFFAYQVCNFLFNGVINLFVDSESRLEPTSLFLPTLPFQLAELLRDTAEPGCRLPRTG